MYSPNCRKILNTHLQIVQLNKAASSNEGEVVINIIKIPYYY